MLNKMTVHGFRTLVNTEVTFSPRTIIIGRNGTGKTTLLNVVQLIGKFARGGVTRAFGPPPWSLGWQRTRGLGQFATTDFKLSVTPKGKQQYHYTLRLSESDGSAVIREESLYRSDNTLVASYEWGMNASGTILHPDPGKPNGEIEAVASVFKSFESYELNPTAIERPNDPKQDYVTRDGFGVAGYLANLKDTNTDRFNLLEARLKGFRPETESIEVWSPSSDTFWGLRDKGQKNPFPAVHLSWGDRVLVGLLCVLFSTPPDATIAIEEIDRGFHPSRYTQIIDLITDAVHDGLVGDNRAQVIVTTHSPSFVNKLENLIDDIRLVQRTPGGGTRVQPLGEAIGAKLGPGRLTQPAGEVWEMGLLEDTLTDAL
jgi:predicted ATPase